MYKNIKTAGCSVRDRVCFEKKKKRVFEGSLLFHCVYFSGQSEEIHMGKLRASECVLVTLSFVS